MKSKTLKIFIIICEIATLIFATQILSISTIFDTILYKNINTQSIDETYLSDKTSSLPNLDFSDTISSSNNLVYVHSNEFGVTINDKDTYSTKEAYSYDNTRRLVNIKVELTPNNLNTYTVNTTDYVSTFNKYQITKSGVKFELTGYAWKNALQPILNKLSNWISTNNQSVLLNCEFKYTDNEKYPRYLNIKAISKTDDGVAININYDIYNNDTNKQPNWETGEFNSVTTSETPSQTTPQLEIKPYANTYATPANAI